MARKMSVMELIEDVEQAREDYRRQKSREEWAKKFAENKSSQGMTSLFEGIKKRLLYEGVADNYDAALRAKMDAIAADSSVPNSKIAETAQRLLKAEAQRVRIEAEDIKAAVDTAISDLTQKAASARNSLRKESDSTLTRYMTELQLTGGPGKTLTEINAQARAAAASGDHGAIEFWTRNYEMLAHKAIEKAPLDEQARHGAAMVSSIAEVGDELFRAGATGPWVITETEAYRQIRNIKRAVVEENLDGIVESANFTANLAADTRMGAAISPRRRTPEEDAAELKAEEIAQAKARLAQLGAD